MRRMAGPASALLGYVLLTQPVASQQPLPPTFQAGVDLLQIDVSVLDKSRHPVTGLTANDFDVRVDGQRRAIVAFKAVDVPPPPPAPSAAWMREVAPDVANNARISGRVVVIVMDDYTMGEARLGPDGVQKARQTALATLEELGPNDRAAVVFTSYRHNAQTFTTDRRLLKKAIEGLVVFLEPAAIAGIGSGDQGFCDCGVCAIQALDAVSQALRALSEQRKIVVYISAGSVVPIPNLAYDAAQGDIRKDLCTRRRGEATYEALRQLQLANVTVQAFDPKGLDLGSVDMGARNRSARGRLDPSGPFDDPNILRLEFLRTMAESTGGRAVVNSNDPDRQVRAAIAESSAYYLLGVEMPAPKPNGGLRPIQVRVNRRDVEVRTRNGFFDPRLKKIDKSVEADDAASSITGVVPALAFPLEVAAVPFATEDGHAALAIVTGVALPGDRTSGPWPRTEMVDLVASLFNPETGDGAGEARERLSVTWAKPDALFGTYEVLSRLPARPGRYELRVGLRTKDARVASVYASVEVPDFDDDLSVSGLALSATPSPIHASSEGFNELTPHAPTTRRAFRKTDEVTAFLRVYQRRREFGRVSVSSRVMNEKDEVVATDAQQVDGRPMGSRSSADYEIGLPISDLSVGEYLLTVEAKLEKRSIQRQLRFRVE